MTRTGALSIAGNVTSDLFRKNTDARWGLSVFSILGGRENTYNNVFVPIGDYNADHLANLLGKVDEWWGNAWGGTYMHEAYVRMVNYYANSYSSKPGYGTPAQYRCQKNNLILVSDGEPSDGPLTSLGVPWSGYSHHL